MTGCRVCGAPMEGFMSFGRMPIANGFLRREDFGGEHFFELAAAFCEPCAMPQLVESVAPERLFNDRYPFFTSSSARMAAHFEGLAADVIRRLPGPDPFVVEIGSNDGTLLRHFAARGIRHLGVEPSANVAAAADAHGVHSLRRFFDEKTAGEIARDHGCADVILAANCFCHVHDLHGLAKGVERLLAPRGVLIFEDPYLGDIVAHTAYDQIYDEHMYYFSVGSVARWLAPYGLQVVDATREAVHGGSMRYAVARLGAARPLASVQSRLREEERMRLHRPETYRRFAARVDQSRDALVGLLRRLKRQGSAVAGYGATSKSTTVLNYCGITTDLVEFISDTTPLKQGTWSPGMHIPVLPHAEFARRAPSHALLFAWNHAAEIMEKEGAFRLRGGKWIGYVPEVKVFD